LNIAAVSFLMSKFKGFIRLPLTAVESHGAAVQSTEPDINSELPCNVQRSVFTFLLNLATSADIETIENM
jgi:hypothetical protein